MSFFSKVAKSLRRSSRRNGIHVNLPGPPIDPSIHAPTPVNSWNLQKAFNFANLPSSVLSTIFLHLDEDSLFDLGRTCRSLNDAVFKSWFSQHTDYNLSGSPTQRIFSLHYPECAAHGPPLQAIRCYLRFPLVPVLMYEMQVTARGLQDVVQQLDNVRAILHRQPILSCVHILFEHIDSAIERSTPEDFAKGYRITRAAWKALLVATVNTALSRGCRELFVRGGECIVDCCIDSRGPRHEFTMPPNGPTSAPLHCGPGPPEVKDAVKAGAREPPTIEAPGAPATTSASVYGSLGYQEPHEPSVLESLKLWSDMLMLPVFLDWTSLLVNSNSSTLTRLTLHLPTTSAEIWARFLSSTTLATLHELTISHGLIVVRQAVDIHPDDLFRFLTRHKTIKKVTIYGVHRGTASSSVLRELNLPSLKFFNAPAEYNLWLLGLPPDRIPELETVVLTTECLAMGDPTHRNAAFIYHLFDEVLHSVANTPRITTLGLQFRIEDELQAWLLQHGDPAHSSSRFVKSLHGIKRLHLTFSYLFDIDLSTCEAIAQLVDTFPNVEHLQLDQILAPTFGLTAKVPMEAIHNLQIFFGERCSRLKWLKFPFCDAVRIVPCSEIARLPVQCNAQQAEPERGEVMHIIPLQPGPPE